MEKGTATIRELRLNFPLIKRKVEQCGEVVITDRGVPSYIISALPPIEPKARPSQPDYWARLSKRKGKPLSPEAARALHEENRGDR